jgi:hypothetical protein
MYKPLKWLEKGLFGINPWFKPGVNYSLIYKIVIIMASLIEITALQLVNFSKKYSYSPKENNIKAQGNAL